MTFKPGQRVRVTELVGKVKPQYIGREGTFVDYKASLFIPVYDCRVHFDGESAPLYGPSESLAPLTDPKADAFLESMRKMKPYEEPTVPQRMTVRIGPHEDVIDFDKL